MIYVVRIVRTVMVADQNECIYRKQLSWRRENRRRGTGVQKEVLSHVMDDSTITWLQPLSLLEQTKQPSILRPPDPTEHVCSHKRDIRWKDTTEFAVTNTYHEDDLYVCTDLSIDS